MYISLPSHYCLGSRQYIATKKVPFLHQKSPKNDFLGLLSTF
jgi:hypothetical protein